MLISIEITNKITNTEHNDVYVVCRLQKMQIAYCIFFGSDCALGDDFDCLFDDVAYVSQECLSKGLMSREETS